ncbi:MAG: hypothetical protein KC546_11310 [Anaerolineae bacterium]|nr:hypothetical protein [Anaerolineae bacterium]MCA9888954.1 hypothetical protein [Anaerolineae bacterium]MCA9892382.1 hypothetical protein [Anaerolineae bacterium]MCB9458971.1 hypothetical protein [Anaerolineaceae bacterium]
MLSRLNPTVLTIVLLLMTAATALAQEEATSEAVETAPPGISMLLLLSGLGAVLLVGYVMSRREASSNES